MGDWARGPYGPGCGKPGWFCNGCEAFADDDIVRGKTALEACPTCGFSGTDTPRQVQLDDVERTSP